MPVNHVIKSPKFAKAFTIAEVIIVLGIIGIVAAHTIPTLLVNYQKQVTITKLKKFYLDMNQAIALSSLENGPPDEWDFGGAFNETDTLKWFDTYLANYLKSTKTVKVTGGALFVYLPNGSKVRFVCLKPEMYTIFYPDGDKPVTKDSHYFWFFTKPADVKNAFIPIVVNTTGTGAVGSREYLTSDPTYGCKQGSFNSIDCAGLIMYDGWKIADDYPW